jgi:nitroimidazol reductase NimA-like FMN-containing flavoprotein (pyridoxamine 5'-phosphate oxidase superfamily)
MPGGRMARCIIANPHAIFKICDSDRSYSKWRAVIIEGKVERLTNYDDILYSVRCIARQRGFQENAFDSIARRVANDPESNSIRLPIKVFGGRISG